MTGVRDFTRGLGFFLVVWLVVAVVEGHAVQSRRAESRLPIVEVELRSAGHLRGTVADDRGAPLEGVMISALGTDGVTFAVCDAEGRFEFLSLSAGPYVVSAHLKGYRAEPLRGLIQVNPKREAIYSFTLRRSSDFAEGIVQSTLLAGFVSPVNENDSSGVQVNSEPAEANATLPPHDHNEKVWRLRHLKRSVLKEMVPGVDIKDIGGTSGSSFPWGARSLLSRAAESSGYLAEMLLDGLPPISGEFSLVTTSMGGRSMELPTDEEGIRGGAFVEFGAPMGRGDWSVRSAITNGDVPTWLLAGSYVTAAEDAHSLDVGVSYGVQRYEQGHPPASLGTFVTENRSVKSVHAFDEWSLSSKVSVDYGARLAMYDDYGGVESTALFSPRASLRVSPVNRTNFRAVVSQRMVAPGSGQFIPSPTEKVWLPPVRAFAPLSLDGRLAERARHVEFVVERELNEAYVVGVRRFYEGVSDQLVTLFGVDNGMRAGLGHYYLTSAGHVNVNGWAVTLSRKLAGRFRGWVDYSVAKAHWNGSEATELSNLIHFTRRPEVEKFHDVMTSVETEIPETATRVRVRYRMNTAYIQQETDAVGPGLGARFDVQIKQALPFLAFDRSSWELLVAVRSLFREPWDGASLYDELLVVRPPKQIVSGLVVRF